MQHTIIVRDASAWLMLCVYHIRQAREHGAKSVRVLLRNGVQLVCIPL